MAKFNWALGLGLLGSLIAGPGLAQQIIPDTTLGAEASQVTENFQGFLGVDGIEGGARRGNNLFHSFEEFGIKDGRSGLFIVDDLAIENILARVTGDKQSELFGTLGTSALINNNFLASPANLFLINPNGIIFGKNANLDVGASFVATSANGIQFEEQGSFSINSLESLPLLNVFPSAFIFRANPGSIVISSQAFAGISLGGTVANLDPLQLKGLRVPNNQSLLVLGGNIVSDDSGLTAAGGRVDLGAVAEAGSVALLNNDNALSFSFPDKLLLADISIINGSRIDTIAGGGGDITVSGRNVKISQSSGVIAGIGLGLGAVGSRAGNIEINAVEKISISGDSNVFNTTFLSLGNSGSIRLSAENIDITNGSSIGAVSLGDSDSGDVSLQADGSISFFGRDPGGGASGVLTSIASFSQVLSLSPNLAILPVEIIESFLEFSGTGNGGDINLTANSVRLSDGAFLGTNTLFAEGNSGNIKIEVEDSFIATDGSSLSTATDGQGDSGNIKIIAGNSVEFEGTQADGSRGGLNSSVNSLSNLSSERGREGGSISVEADSLLLKGGAAIRAAVFGEGNAGEIILDINNTAQINGTSMDGQSSGIFSTLEQGSVGSGGRLVLSVGRLEVIDGAQLNASTFGNGDAGSIVISASDRVQFKGSSANGQFASAAFSSVGFGGEGNGGNVEITAPVLEVLDGARLSASTFGKGNAGNVHINASERVLLKGTSTDTQLSSSAGPQFFSAVGSSVQSDGEGNGGNVMIAAPILEVLDGARLIASTSGVGDAGNVLVTASDKVRFQGTSANGQFISAAFSSVDADGEGNGGNVVIETPILEVLDSAQLTASTGGIGDAGNVLISASDRVRFQNGDAFSGLGAGGLGKGGNVVISVPILEVLDGAQLIADTRSAGDAGNVEISAGKRVLLDGTDPITGRSSAIFTGNGQLLGDGSVLGGTGKGGNIKLNTSQLQLRNGAVIDSRTTNDQIGGNITLNLDTLELLNGGQILTTSDSSGAAGTIRLNVSDSIRLFGTDPTHATRLTKFGDAVAPITENSGINIRSIANGPAGNLIINSPQLHLSDNSQIIADSEATTGGNLNFNLNQALLIEGNSLISATAGRNQGEGDGGNITVQSPFVISFPNENSDIIANAFSGTGGNITINADAILNFQRQDDPNFDALRSNSTNDISASSPFGNPGSLSLAGLNVDPAQGTNQLPTNLLSPADQVSRRCAAERVAGAGSSEFFITGRSGLPIRPGDAPTSRYSTGTIATTSDAPTLAATTNAASNTVLAEAGSWKRDSQGNIQLIASSLPLAVDSKVECDRPTASALNSLNAPNSHH